MMLEGISGVDPADRSPSKTMQMWYQYEAAKRSRQNDDPAVSLQVKNDDGQAMDASSTSKNKVNLNEKYRCHTCENRKYQDGSDDPGVSFKSPSKLTPEQAASAVVSHEREHVFREQAKAKEEGAKVVSQTVSIHTGICSECGKVYVAGGTTRTVTKSGGSADGQTAAGNANEGKGNFIDAAV